MSAHTSISRLAICGSCARHTRVSKFDWTAKGDPPPNAERPRHTRVSWGPPQEDHAVSNEGPAQPALRRLGLRQKRRVYGQRIKKPPI
jgi:hypothetical protein